MKASLHKILRKSLPLSQISVPCDLCSADAFGPFWNCGDFAFVKCLACGLVMQNPQPELSSVRKLYDKDYFQYELDHQNAFFHLMSLALRDIRFDALAQNLSEKTFLDIGCATGLLLNALKCQGWNVSGVEICRESAQYAQENFQLNVFNKSLDECAFPNDSFEVVHFSHVIEHVPSPASLLKEVFRITRPKGFVIITTPNVQGLFARVFQKNWRASIAQHLFLFSTKTLSRLLKETGFSVLKQVSWGSVPVEMSRGFLKKTCDKLVKKWNLGDVTLILAQKHGSET